MHVELVSVSKGVGKYEKYTSDELIAYMARVSNPSNQENTKTAPKLLKYLMKHKHWSPFEMGDACVYIECPRSISRQILRHRSFSFQEFSGRYASYDSVSLDSEVRMVDTTNRQNSLPCGSDSLRETWRGLVSRVAGDSYKAYRYALDLGIAKEVARSLLPEGLTPSKMYMKGSIRSWIHYWDVRCDPATQKEHRDVAEETRKVILNAYPSIAEIIE